MDVSTTFVRVRLFATVSVCAQMCAALIGSLALAMSHITVTGGASYGYFLYRVIPSIRASGHPQSLTLHHDTSRGIVIFVCEV